MLLSKRGVEWYIEIFALLCTMQGGTASMLQTTNNIPGNSIKICDTTPRSPFALVVANI